MEIWELDAADRPTAVHKFSTVQRWVYRFELELLLAAAGFTRWEILGGFDGRPLDAPDDQMIARAFRADGRLAGLSGHFRRRGLSLLPSGGADDEDRFRSPPFSLSVWHRDSPPATASSTPEPGVDVEVTVSGRHRPPHRRAGPHLRRQSRRVGLEYQARPDDTGAFSRRCALGRPLPRRQHVQQLLLGGTEGQRQRPPRLERLELGHRRRPVHRLPEGRRLRPDVLPQPVRPHDRRREPLRGGRSGGPRRQARGRRLLRRLLRGRQRERRLVEPDAQHRGVHRTVRPPRPGGQDGRSFGPVHGPGRLLPRNGRRLPRPAGPRRRARTSSTGSATITTAAGSPTATRTGSTSASRRNTATAWTPCGPGWPPAASPGSRSP